MKMLESRHCKTLCAVVLLIFLGCYFWVMGLYSERITNRVFAADAVAQPVFSPETGSYLSAQTVTVTCATPGATIRYTKDGTAPTTTSPVIATGGTISVPKTMTLKARAWKKGYATSLVASASYEICIVSTPTLNVKSGTYAAVQKVIVKCATPDAVVHYTTNGIDPTESDPTVVSGSTVTVDQTMTLKTRAFKTDWTPSDVKSALYTIKVVDAPVFTPDAGSYLAAQSVIVSCPTPGATIRYTKDGTTPTTASPTVVSGKTITISKTAVLKARAWKSGYGTSPTKSANYEIRIVATPALGLKSGTYTSVKKVLVSCGTAGAVIHYTTSGVDPTENDPIVEPGSTVIVDQSMNIKFKAFKTDWTPSAVRTATYRINIVKMPVFSPDAGVYPGQQQVTVTCPTSGAIIRFTKDGTTPTTASPIVASGGKITISKTSVLKARAWKSGFGPSPIRTADYEIRIVATPTLSVKSGTYDNAQQVTAACATPGAVIHYTTNGNEPTESDPAVSSGDLIRVGYSLTLKAKAWMSEWGPSAVATANYTISKVMTPTLDPPGGELLDHHVTVRCETPGATIRYTTDETEPDTTSPTVADGGQIEINQSLTVKVRAWKKGLTVSDVGSESYVVPLEFADPQLERAVRQAINKPSGAIYPEDVTELQKLDVKDREIASLDGIQRLTALTELNLSENQIGDLTPLTKLSNLKSLDLSDNRFVNIQPLANLTQLEKLLLNQDLVHDIQALSGLTNLKHLELNDSLLLGVDFAPLASLRKLEVLSLNSNNLEDEDLSPILSLPNLRDLSLATNYIHNGAAFTSLSHLERLDLNTNEVRDPSKLFSLISLKKLCLSNNDIRNINGLSALTNLQYLDLSQNKISDISELTGLFNLTYLNLEDNRIESPETLSGLTILEDVYIGSNPITSISFLTGLIHLTTLDISNDNNVKDIAVLNQLTGIKNLNLRNCCGPNLSFLVNLRNLESLDLSSNNLMDLNSILDITGMANLKVLNLGYNDITDIRPIEILTNLQELDLSCTTIRDFSPLSSLINLKRLEAVYCGINDISIFSNLADLEFLNLGHNHIENIQGLTNLTNLKKLDLSNNRISNIDTLSMLSQLHDLALENNQIESIDGIANLKDLRYLNLSGNLIEDLSPISTLFSLRTLDVYNLYVQDFDALRGLTALQWLYAGPRFGDLSVLNDLTNLKSLTLGLNPNTDLSLLTRFDRLVIFNILSGSVHDYSVFSSLQTLRYLLLNDMGIADIHVLQNLPHLHFLSLEMNRIASLDGISNLNHLQTLLLNYNQITDLTPLGGLVNLNSLYLSNNQLTDVSVLLDLPTLSVVSLNKNPTLNTEVGSSADQVIQALIAKNCDVYYDKM